MNNQEFKVGLQIVIVNSNSPVFFPFSIKTSRCSGRCNSINNPYAKICVPDVIKNLNVKVFNLMSRANETRHIKWHETCKCKCRLNASVCNNKQRWNNDKWRMCDKLDECECDKSSDVGEYLDYENCKCRKKLLDKLVDECTEVVEEVKLAKITLAENENMYKCNSCTLDIVLFSIIFTISVGIAAYFVYFHW